MDTIISEDNLPVFEALASKVRIRIIELLTQKPMIMKDLAAAVGLSNSIITMHIKKLEKAGIVRTEIIPGKAAGQKQCTLIVDRLEFVFPTKDALPKSFHLMNVSVGHFTDFDVKPTCGLASKYKILGGFDDPRYFLHSERMDAKLLWFSQGFVEYKIPNFLSADETPQELELSMEIASEAPLSNDHWPSDISFYLNDVLLGQWTSPGDFGGSRGKYTPEWWDINLNQHGLLVQIRVNSEGTFIGNNRLSDVTIRDIHVQDSQWKLRFAVLEDAVNVGGLTIYGAGFGNYYQDILLKLFYTAAEPE